LIFAAMSLRRGSVLGFSAPATAVMVAIMDKYQIDGSRCSDMVYISLQSASDFEWMPKNMAAVWREI
jgi:hypothetical protein